MPCFNQIPEDAEPGNYTLLVEGSNDDHMIMTVFRNESKLFFDQRHVSCFIFTDQRRYQKRSTVNFRVVALDPDLTPVKSGSIDIYVKVSLFRIRWKCILNHRAIFKDGVGQYVRRWLGQQVNQGIINPVWCICLPDMPDIARLLRRKLPNGTSRQNRMVDHWSIWMGKSWSIPVPRIHQGSNFFQGHKYTKSLQFVNYCK